MVITDSLRDAGELSLRLIHRLSPKGVVINSNIAEISYFPLSHIVLVLRTKIVVLKGAFAERQDRVLNFGYFCALKT